MTQTLPLAGLRVLEMAHTVMGPTCGVVLADLGADVIRVEPAPDGDHTRRLGGFASGFFAYFNRNKRGVAINLKTAAGLEAAQDLVRGADILLENFGPGTLDRLGLGWDVLHRLNPRLILCELKGFMPGPYEHRPAMDEVVQFMSGLAYMTGPPGTPMRAGSSVVDIMGGVMGAVAILAALRQRDADGRGRRVSGTLYESAAFMVAQHMAQQATTGIPTPPMPARGRAWSIYETFPTRDGAQLFIAVVSEKHWRALCELLGLQDVMQDPRFANNADRLRNLQPLRAAFVAATMRHDAASLSAMLEGAGVPFSPVQSPGDLFNDAQLNAHGRMLPIRMTNGKVVGLPALPLSIDGRTMGLRLQPPEVGEHTDAIFAALGYGAARIAALRADGALG
jgi:crotonobetainyl-CoA:carnitine CoA-transferase CaiB-like acyl-CoA transferase